jgi:hypothetical protein
MACKEKSSNWSQHIRKVTEASAEHKLAVKKLWQSLKVGKLEVYDA